MDPKRRDPGIRAASDLAARARFTGCSGTCLGARAGQRARRCEGRPRRLDPRGPRGAAPSHPRRLRRRARAVARGEAVSSGPSPLVPLGEEKLARAALTYLAEPADPALGALLAICSPAEVLAAIKADMLPGIGPGCGDTPASRAALERALGRWRARLPGLPDDDWIAGARRDGIRLVCPGDAEWPGALDQLDQARPYAL